MLWPIPFHARESMFVSIAVKFAAIFKMKSKLKFWMKTACMENVDLHNENMSR